jgi:hypothetical protein
MSAAAQENTAFEHSEKLSASTWSYSFGKPTNHTFLTASSASTAEDSELRRTVQLPSLAHAFRTAARPMVAEEYFKPLRNWEGVVETLSEKTFTATMRDTENKDDRGEEQFEIDIEDVDEGDRDLVVPGGIFYFTVGYRIRRGGTRIKGTEIVFRRMPRWSKKDIQRAKERADKLLELMTGDSALERRA